MSTQPTFTTVPPQTVATNIGNTIRSFLPTVTNSMKWWLAIFLALLFFVLAFPGTYNLTNSLWSAVGLPRYLSSSGCPTVVGVLIHAAVFGLIVRILLW